MNYTNGTGNFNRNKNSTLLCYNIDSKLYDKYKGMENGIENLRLSSQLSENLLSLPISG